MATTIILESATTFILQMTEEDMERLTDIVLLHGTDYYEAVLACFHAGLVKLSENSRNLLAKEHYNGTKQKRSLNPKDNQN